MAACGDVVSHLDGLLDAASFKDYGPNGLQVQGRSEIRHPVSGVTASRALIEAAVADGADALLVHHGLFWRGHDGRLTGWLAERVRLLMAHGVNLIAYHLPLDAHAELGNNAQLGRELGWTAQERFGEQRLGFLGAIGPTGLGDLAQMVEGRLGRACTRVEGDGRPIRRVAWCTGGAQGYFESAIAARTDVFLTGEISEPQAHLARETGVAFLACGHHATERYGAPAPGAHVAERFGFTHRFIEIDNPAWTMSPPLLLTLGDPVGIGPEIVWKAHRAGALEDTVVVGSPAVLRRARAGLGEDATDTAGLAVLSDLAEAEASPPGALRVWNPGREGAQLSDVDGLDRLPWGQADARAGAAAARWVQAAAQAVLGQQARALVTAPLNKAALAAAGVPFPGHTELLQHECRDTHGAMPPVRMMLANPELRVVLVTIHLGLREAIDALSIEGVLQTLRITDAALRRQGLAKPRLGVAGLNPHAGEGGLFGREEIEIIGPAIAAARAEGIDADGPHPPDTVFMRARTTADRPGAFDAVVAMTHDHGLIPVKYLGVEQGVNVTLGLPLVRTSPDHGTAFDIAGQGRADPSSLLAALAMARRMVPTS